MVARIVYLPIALAVGTLARKTTLVLMRYQAELHRLILTPAVRMILAPNSGAEIPRRLEAYTQCAPNGLTQLPDDQIYQALVASGVKMLPYGDHERKLTAAGFLPEVETYAMPTDATDPKLGLRTDPKSTTSTRVRRRRTRNRRSTGRNGASAAVHLHATL